MSHSDTLLYPLLLLLLPVLHTLHPYSKLYSHSSYNCILQMSRDWIKLRNGLLCCSQYKISFCLVIIIVISFHITQQLSKHLLFFALVWYYYGIRFKIVDTCCILPSLYYGDGEAVGVMVGYMNLLAFFHLYHLQPQHNIK